MKTRIFAAGLIMAAAITTGCRGKAGEVLAGLKVRRGAFQIVIPAFGELQAAKSTPIVVPPESRFGRQTIGWMVPEYSSVRTGDVVIRLASTELAEFLQTEEAALTKIDLEINTKEKQLQ